VAQNYLSEVLQKSEISQAQALNSEVLQSRKHLLFFRSFDFFLIFGFNK
jgi:hypothetical protein